MNKRDDTHKVVHIKSERMDFNQMPLSKIVQNVEDEQNDRLIVWWY
jgi:hypothetical protein